jgi:hypothetical protein
MCFHSTAEKRWRTAVQLTRHLISARFGLWSRPSGFRLELQASGSRLQSASAIQQWTRAEDGFGEYNRNGGDLARGQRTTLWLCPNLGRNNNRPPPWRLPAARSPLPSRTLPKGTPVMERPAADLPREALRSLVVTWLCGSPRGAVLIRPWILDGRNTVSEPRRGWMEILPTNVATENRAILRRFGGNGKTCEMREEMERDSAAFATQGSELLAAPGASRARVAHTAGQARRSGHTAAIENADSSVGTA